LGVIVSEDLKQRQYWLDWLRVLAMGTIFLYHSGLPFSNYTTWAIMNSEPDPIISLFTKWVSMWVMPLFFVISGMAACFSLSKRSPVQFAGERFKRLMIPFLTAGLLLVLPVERYYYEVFLGSFSGNFVNFYAGPYFLKFLPLSASTNPTSLFNSNQGDYLWFLFWLFVFSLLTVYFFKWLTKQENRDKISRLASISNRIGGIFLLAIPLIIVNVAALPPFFVFPTRYDWWKLPTYLAFFITAYVLAIDHRFEQSIDKNKILALILGVAFSFLLWSSGLEALASTTPIRYITFSAIWALNGWCWIIAIIGFGRKLLSFNHRFLRTSNELVLPFYILHQAVIVAIAFYVVSFNFIPIEKYVIIILASFAIISLLLLPIRRFNPLRFLFGMRAKKE
jgi:surface polysaccharide O-acyltransferase-like enzyme